MTRNKLAYEEQLQETKAFIESVDDVLVVSHVNPDGDAISSTAAVGWLLQSLGKTYTMMNEGPCPPKFHYLYGADRIIDASKETDRRLFRHVIAVDCADFQRIGKVAEWFADDVRIVNIDHHPTNDYYGEVNLIRADAAATAEILFDLLDLFSIEWDQDIATCIYTGLLTDTGGFRYANTNSHVMNVAARLLNYGVEASHIAEHLLERMTKSHVSLLKRALNTLKFNEDETIGWLAVRLSDMEETKAANEDLEGLVNYARNVEGVEVGILFKEVQEDVYKVSMRSAGKANVAEIAQSFGGGGHIRAAGCTIEGKLEDIIQAVVERTKKDLNRS